MRVLVTGKQLDIGETLKRHIEEKLVTTVSKYFERPIEGQVTISRNGPLYRADLSAHIGTGMLLKSHGEGGDAAAGFETALDKLGKRLRRYKRRLRDHREGVRMEVVESVAQSYILAAEGEEEGVAVDGRPTIVAEMRTAIPTVPLSDAVMRMDLADVPVLMFRNQASGELNVIYRREDGNIGWIEPRLSDAPAMGKTDNL